MSNSNGLDMEAILLDIQTKGKDDEEQKKKKKKKRSPMERKALVLTLRKGLE